jgi:hypothetical protein
MLHRVSRWLLFGLLLSWSLSHATVFGQQNEGAAPDRVRQGLNKTITIDYTGQSLNEVLNHFRDKTGLALNLDQNNIAQMGVNLDDNLGQVQIKATNEKAGQVLRRLLANHHLTYLVQGDGLLVTSEFNALQRQMQQRVNVDLEDVPLKKAVRDLARTHGLNLVIDPKVLKQAETPVSLQLENAGIETTIRLLAELGSLKAVRMGNVMFVTTEEKAKKIRDEEPHQFDNPLNPNVPRVGPFPFMGGGIAGGFGLGGGGFGGIGGKAVLPALPAPQAPPADPTPADVDPNKVKRIEEKKTVPLDPLSDNIDPARLDPVVQPPRSNPAPKLKSQRP